MSRLRRFLGKVVVEIIVDIVAGIVLYLILGGYISEPLSEISPHLPTLLLVSLVLTIVGGFFFRFFKSVRFHRLIERTSHDLIMFLKEWDELGNAFVKAIDSQSSGAIKKFEDTRTSLLYTYPKISSAVKIMRYDYIDRAVGISVRRYDVIGNLIGKSPFTRMEWFNREFVYKDFMESWDVGRTILVASIGYYDKYRSSLTHRMLWLLHLVPFPTLNKSDNKNRINDLSII